MTSKTAIEDFLSQQRLAIVGVSRGGKKFGNVILQELKTKGYSVFPVNPHADLIAGEPCYPDLGSLPEPVGGVVIVVPPASTEQVVKDAARAGIRRIWMQQGSESETAVRFCEDNGVSVISGECILMFAKPGGFHRFHRWVWGVLGKLPD